MHAHWHCLTRWSRGPSHPRLQQPLPFWRQISQITCPQLVRLNRGVGLRGSQKQTLQKTWTAMGRRIRRARQGAGGWGRSLPSLPSPGRGLQASLRHVPLLWGSAAPWGEGWLRPSPTRGGQGLQSLTLTPLKKGFILASHYQTGEGAHTGDPLWEIFPSLHQVWAAELDQRAGLQAGTLPWALSSSQQRPRSRSCHQGSRCVEYGSGFSLF